MQILLFVCLALPLLSSCSAVQKPRANTLVLSYDDFGPQVMSYKQLGMGWYQWNSQGPDDPNATDDIRVVVYRDISADEVKRIYPVIKKKQDYRYLEYRAALDLLKKYEQDPFWNEHKETQDRARQTKEKILAQLGN